VAVRPEAPYCAGERNADKARALVDAVESSGRYFARGDEKRDVRIQLMQVSERR